MSLAARLFPDEFYRDADLRLVQAVPPGALDILDAESASGALAEVLRHLVLERRVHGLDSVPPAERSGFSTVFADTAEVYHVRGIRTATYDLLNGAGDVVLANQAFDTWSSTDGMDVVLSDATHPGYWPATPSTNYHLRVNLESSNLIAAAQTIPEAADRVGTPRVRDH